MILKSHLIVTLYFKYVNFKWNYLFCWWYDTPTKNPCYHQPLLENIIFKAKFLSSSFMLQKYRIDKKSPLSNNMQSRWKNEIWMGNILRVCFQEEVSVLSYILNLWNDYNFYQMRIQFSSKQENDDYDIFNFFRFSLLFQLNYNSKMQTTLKCFTVN